MNELYQCFNLDKCPDLKNELSENLPEFEIQTEQERTEIDDILKEFDY